MDLRYTEPTVKEARKWNKDHPADGVSAFACLYPGRYTQAADALRKVRRTKK